MCLEFAVLAPERMLGTGEHCGLQWAIVHNNMGFRCGYVRVPEGHPLHGVSYDDGPDDVISVHGGLTFSEPDMDCGNGKDGGWWFGFDCGHFNDAPDPGLAHPHMPDDIIDSWYGVVRTQEYVEAECRSLAEQLAAMKSVKRGISFD